MPKPIWDAFFRKKYAGKHFCERKFSTRCAPIPKAFPSGGRWAGEAGSDEGAIWYPTFPCRKGTLSRLSPQRNFSSVPLGKSVAPSSVTFGDSFPPRGSLWVVQPYTKKRPKSGHVHGHRTSPSTGTMRPTTPKPASGNERAMKKGVQGARPPASFLRLSPEKAGLPPGVGREPTWQVWTCASPDRPPCQLRQGDSHSPAGPNSRGCICSPRRAAATVAVTSPISATREVGLPTGSSWRKGTK